MSLNTVLTEALTITQNTTGLAYASRYHPLFIDPTNSPSAVVWIGDHREERKGFGGSAPTTDGRKWRHLMIHAEIYHFSQAPENAEDNFRDLLDALANSWRSNQTLNGAVLRFGEDITIEVDRPFNHDASTVCYRAVLSSEATEEIVA